SSNFGYSDGSSFCSLAASMLLMRLFGRISGQCRSIYSRQAARLSDLRPMVHPPGRSTKLGQGEYWPSSLIKTWKVPLSSSNGLVILVSFEIASHASLAIRREIGRASCRERV